MKYLGKPAGMWALFAGSFEKHLTVEFDLTAGQAKDVAARAKKKYREIIAKLPEFDKRDRFEMNIVTRCSPRLSCACRSGRTSKR